MKYTINLPTKLHSPGNTSSYRLPFTSVAVHSPRDTHLPEKNALPEDTVYHEQKSSVSTARSMVYSAGNELLGQAVTHPRDTSKCSYAGRVGRISVPD